MRNEVERGRKARQIAPKSRKSAFLENTTGSKKWPSKISKGTPSEVQRLLAAEGLRAWDRVSATVRVFSAADFALGKGLLTGLAGALPIWGEASANAIALPLTIRRMRRLRRRSRLRRPIFWNCCRCRNWNGNRTRTGTMTRRNDGLTTCRICLCLCS